MAMKYPNKLIPGDKVLLEDGNIQIVESTTVDRKNMSIKFRSGKTFLVNANTQLPVIVSNFDPSQHSIDEVYNMILDDRMSLYEFTLWCSEK
jgi:hypothetical protein